MKTLFVFLVLAFNTSWAGVFLENLPGTERIYRGRAPKTTEMKRLVQKGITTVIIFKNETKNEVKSEIEQLTQAGISAQKIHYIPFLWKDIKNEKLACEQVIEALQILQQVENSRKDKVLFHCTVGEDRTGLLAGLMTQLLSQGSTLDSYQQQMCEKGYAGGNREKPAEVSRAVNQYLTPLYFKISSMIERGEVSSDNLDKKVCQRISKMQVVHSFQSCE